MKSINKKFLRGGQLYSISNDEKEKDLFVFKRDEKVLTKLIGCSGNIWDKTRDFRFETLRPTCTFPDPIDRLAITDAIAYLEDRYKTP